MSHSVVGTSCAFSSPKGRPETVPRLVARGGSRPRNQARRQGDKTTPHPQPSRQGSKNQPAKQQARYLASAATVRHAFHKRDTAASVVRDAHTCTYHNIQICLNTNEHTDAHTHTHTHTHTNRQAHTCTPPHKHTHPQANTETDLWCSLSNLLFEVPYLRQPKKCRALITHLVTYQDPST